MKKNISLLLRLLGAVIMLQTLYFKFSGAEESVYIFTQVGIEPWGRIGTGVAELIASVLLLWPRTVSLGALLAMGIMGGAMFTHFTLLGVDVKGDGGQFFLYALLVFFSSAALSLMYWEQLVGFRNKIFAQ